MRDPFFWHQRDLKARSSAPLTRALLTPVSALYQWAGARRIEKTTPYKADIPVICIGNLTVGGSGKTPVVQRIRERLTECGYRAASLSRGYKGDLKGPLKVDFNTHTARQVGDEPLMLACSGEAWIGADRVLAAKAMQENGVDVIIMDDGHQNPTLHKDFSLIIMDGGNPYGNGFVFPKGPLREPAGIGLQRADAVLVMGDLAHKVPELNDYQKPVFHGRIQPNAPAPEGRLVAFAGIGRPQKFFETLEAFEGQIVETVPFPDHHAFTRNDLNYLQKLASEREASLITTEKDYIRLSRNDRDSVLVFPVFCDLVNSDIDDLIAPVLNLLR